MILQIPDVLTAAELAEARSLLDRAEWMDARGIAGQAARDVTSSLQVPEDHPASGHIGTMILNALERNPLFMAAALPTTVLPPLLICNREGEAFATGIDNAIRSHRASGQRIRADLTASLFFSNPDEYDGGELILEDTYGTHSIKLPAGHLILSPSTGLRHLTPIARGARVYAHFWIQSMIRDDGERSLLFDLDMGLQRLGNDAPNHPAVLQLTGVYNNLLRRWAEV